MKKNGLAVPVIVLLAACGAKPSADQPDASVGPVDEHDSSIPMGDSGPAGTAPVLAEVRAMQSGRFGDDVRIAVRASDVDGDATSVRIVLRTASGQEIKRYDSLGTGTLDSGQVTLALDAPIVGTEVGDGEVTLAGLHREESTLASVDVSVLDSHGRVSNMMSANVAEQPRVSLDGLCDVNFVTDRCEDGLACRDANPSVCVAGVAPVLFRVGYFTDAGAVRVLIEGEDEDQDVTELRIEFFDANDAPVSLDLDGDGIAEATSFDADVRGAGAQGTFFYAFNASDEFAAQVGSVRITAIDRGGRESAAMASEGAAAPSVSVGNACDAAGFNRCNASVCMPSSATAYRCVAYPSARSMACAAAPTVDAFAGGKVQGLADGPSLWNAPSGCSSGDPQSRPEGIVRIHVARDAAHLVLSTDDGYSNFDTTLYLLSACDAAPVVAWCADDLAPTAERSWLSELRLENVRAGDYYVIVDSFAPAGGRFSLTVSAD